MADENLVRRGVLMVHARYRQPGGEDVSVAVETALLRQAGVPVRRLDLGPVADGGLAAGLGALWNRRAVAALRDAVAEARPAVVHVQNLWPAASPAVVAAATALGLPVVVTLRNARFLCAAASLWRRGAVCGDCVAGPWPALRRGCWRDSRAATLVAVAAHRWHPAWRGVRRFIAPSAFLRDALAPVIDARRVTVVANRLPPLPPSSAVSAGGGRRGILFAGRLVPEKGIAVLAEAARRLGAPLTVLGQGPIVLPGARPASHAAVLEAMTRAAVVAVPSLWPEPFGRSALEGMACGAAVVASAVGGLPEVVGPAGLLVPPGDVAAWTEALWRALDDPRQFGRLGRARAAALAGDGAAPLIAVYRSVLTAPDSSHPTASSAKAGTVRA